MPFCSWVVLGQYVSNFGRIDRKEKEIYLVFVWIINPDSKINPCYIWIDLRGNISYIYTLHPPFYFLWLWIYAIPYATMKNHPICYPLFQVVRKGELPKVIQHWTIIPCTADSVQNVVKMCDSFASSSNYYNCTPLLPSWLLWLPLRLANWNT